MPKKRHKVVVEVPVQAQPEPKEPRVEEEFPFNRYTTKRIKVQFVAEAEVMITDVK